MAQIRGVYGAVDEVGAAWRNDIEDIRSMIWDAYGAQEGVVRGFDWSLTAGSLAATLSPGAALIEERGVDVNGDARAYYVFNDVDTDVLFDAPSAASRNDAVVICWADPQYGNDITSHDAVTAAGPQVVVVKGTSGSTVPRTDTQINTAVGPGGWFRYADVIIAPGNTQVSAGNVTLADVRLAHVEDAWVDFTPVLTASTTNPTYTVNVARYKVIGTTVHVFVNIDVSSAGSGTYSLSKGELPDPYTGVTPALQAILTSSTSRNIMVGFWNLDAGFGIPSSTTANDWNAGGSADGVTNMRLSGTYEMA